MKYAVNKLTGELESADGATHYGMYVCHECKTRVTLRSGTKRRPYFAHWRGLGSPECEKFVPGNYLSSDWHSFDSHLLPKETLELRLNIPSRRKESWSLELTVPSCKPSDARVVIDVGGRFQFLDMNGMTTSRTISADPSHKPYRIVQYQGDPDPSFVLRVERECPGLRAIGATVFTTLANSERKGFSIAKELRYSEAFAFMWEQPLKVSFPELLNIEFFSQRDGWNLALVSIPDSLPNDVIDWLWSFTGLKVHNPLMSIDTLWPVVNNRSNLDEVECRVSGTTLMFVNNVPMELEESPLDVWVKSGIQQSECSSLSGNEKLFSFEPQDSNLVSFTLDYDLGIYKVFSFLRETERTEVFEQTTVDLVFCNANKERKIISLHQGECNEKVRKLLYLGFWFEYLSIPRGVEGKLKLYKPDARVINLSAGNTKSPHTKSSFILESDLLDLIVNSFNNSECDFEIDFGGFGCIYVNGFFCKNESDNVDFILPGLLRQSLLSYLSQLSISKLVLSPNDQDLVCAFLGTKPSVALIPHYRALSSRILACEGSNVFVKDVISI